MLPFAIFNEHPYWFKPLFSELSKQGIPYQSINPTKHQFAIEERMPRFSLFFNCMSPSAYLRKGVQGIFYTLNYVKHLEHQGIRVINGYRAFTYAASKALQLMLLAQLGLKHPKSRVVNHSSQLEAAANDLQFPVIIKTNVGGSGADILKFDDTKDLREAVACNRIDLGVDHTVIVQEFIRAKGNCITRVETLGGKYLYAIRVHSSKSFNVSPADSSLRVEAFTPSAAIIKKVETIVQQCGIDAGGVEYLIDDRNGEVLYYDINALSNFLAEAEDVIGFNPNERLVEYLEQEAVKKSEDVAVV